MLQWRPQHISLFPIVAQQKRAPVNIIVENLRFHIPVVAKVYLNTWPVCFVLVIKQYFFVSNNIKQTLC